MVAVWTGREANALREAMRLSIDDFAVRACISRRAVANWSARGSGMRDRTIKAQADAKKHFDEYVQTQAHSTPADELHKLNDLKEKGALSAEEFDKAKAKLLA